LAIDEYGHPRADLTGQVVGQNARRAGCL